MKAFITGIAGFVGGYLAKYLQKECGWSVYGTKLKQESFQMEGVSVFDLDLLEEKAVKELLLLIRPDVIFHLAAQSSVALSWKNPALTLDVNGKGCIHLLEAVRWLEKKPRILLVGSSEEYGTIDEEEPVKEERVLHPGNIYAATKACQTMLGKIYADAYQMELILVRAFNQIGPGQSPVFAVSDFCKQVAEIEEGKREPVLWTGNRSVKRDFTDVRDIVRAYAMLIQAGKAGEIYNVGSGVAISLQKILDQIQILAKRQIRMETDPKRLRPNEIPVIQADIRKLKEATGWERQIPLENTLEEMLDDWRKKLFGSNSKTSVIN